MADQRSFGKEDSRAVREKALDVTFITAKP